MQQFAAKIWTPRWEAEPGGSRCNRQPERHLASTSDIRPHLLDELLHVTLDEPQTAAGDGHRKFSECLALLSIAIPHHLA